MTEWRQGEYAISTERVDVTAVHAYLTTSYWAAGIPLDVVERSLTNALAFSLWHEPAGASPAQVGLTRVVTDRATVAYVGDVYVLEAHRGRGLSKWMMQTVVAHPDLQGLRRWILLTRDAHGLYTQFGFTPLNSPDRWMERWAREVYRRADDAKR
jgi:GNAT superfamily N-acetyltransferase